MNATLPGNKPTASVLSVLKSPTAIQRSILNPELRFLSEYLFRGTISADSGSAEYYIEDADSMYASRGDARIIEPLSNYPTLEIRPEARRVVSTDKFGTSFEVAYEAVRRNNMDPITKGRATIRNHIVRLDAQRAIAAVDAAATEFSRIIPASAVWTTEFAADNDVSAAAAAAFAKGIAYDTLLINPLDARDLRRAPDVRDALKGSGAREDSPIYNSVFSPLAGMFGLEVIVNALVPKGKVYLVERNMAGIVVLEQGLWVRQNDEFWRDAWLVQGSMLSAPAVDAPERVAVITGVS